MDFLNYLLIYSLQKILDSKTQVDWKEKVGKYNKDTKPKKE